MTRRRVKLSTLGPIVSGGILAVAIIALTLIGSKTGIDQGQRILLYDARATLATASRLLFNPVYTLDVTTLEDTVDKFLDETNIVHVAVRDTTGQIMAEATDGWVPEELFSRDLAAQALAQGDIVHREIQGHLVLSGPIAVGSEQVGTLTTVVDPSRGVSNTFAYMIVALTSLGILTVVVILIAVLARRLTAPLRALTVAAENIGRGNLDNPVPIQGTEETATLGTAMERMRTDLQELYSTLEQQAATQERRVRQLQVATDVAQAAAAELDAPALLQRAVTLIRERFSFYHTGIFMLDEAGEWAVLRALSSQDEQPILEQGYKVRVGQNNIIGYVTERGEAHIASNLGEDAVNAAHPNLAGIHSRLALPLYARGDLLGVLDVHSTTPDAFTDEDVNVLQIVANQVATAISNAQLFQQAQENLQAMQRAYGELSREGWADLLRAQPNLGYYGDASGVIPAVDISDVQHDEELPEISIPVTMRGQAIGTISAHKHGDTGEWTAEELTLMQALTDQLSVALENARLHQATQRRAARERLTSEITTRMRETLDVDTVLQTALHEIRETLGLSEAEVWMGIAPAPDDNGSMG